jgi:hypothetical protein
MSDERRVERMAMECEKTGCDADKCCVFPWLCSPLARQMRSWTFTGEKGSSREDLRMFDGEVSSGHGCARDEAEGR